MQIVRFFNKQNYGNSYAVINDDEYILIDCTQTAQDVSSKLNRLCNREMQCVGIFVTHGHYDHFSHLLEWINNGTKVYATQEAFYKMADKNLNCSSSFDQIVEIIVPQNVMNVVEDQQKLQMLGKDIIIHKLPGHTDCSMAIEIEDNLFVGDVIFAGGGLGRCDLPTGSVAQMQESLEKLNNMNGNLNVKPGHGLGFVLGECKPFRV